MFFDNLMEFGGEPLLEQQPDPSNPLHHPPSPPKKPMNSPPIPNPDTLPPQKSPLPEQQREPKPDAQPEIKEEEKEVDPFADESPSQIEIYKEKEKVYQKQQKETTLNANTLLNEKKAWGEANVKRFSIAKSHIGGIYNQREKLVQMKRAGANEFGFQVVGVGNRKRFKKTREFYFSDQELYDISQKDDVLVPIRLDAEIEGIKIRDAFTWNMNDNLISPELFCETLLDDLKVPPHLIPSFVVILSKSIRDQVVDFFQHSPEQLAFGNGDGRGLVNERGQVVDDKRDAPDLRFTIKLDITINDLCLVDSIEWDLNCKRNNPEIFAEKLTQELSLPREFITAISHSIREQIYTYGKSLLLVDHKFDGSEISADEELAASFLPPLGYSKRDAKTKEQGPLVFQVDGMEREKMEKDLDRETRRKRRTQRFRRAVTLPDREPLKSTRTRLPGMNETFEIPNKNEDDSENSDEDFTSIKNIKPFKKTNFTPAYPMNVNLGKKPKETVSNVVSVVLAVCKHCGCSSDKTPVMRNGPDGPNTLCNACGIYYLQHKKLPSLDTLETTPPTWLKEQVEQLQERYQTGVTIVDRNGEWRLRCEKCPGKLYGVGPEETVESFKSHLESGGHQEMSNLS